MQRKQRLLFDTLDRHEAHTRATHRFADRLGIVAVVLTVAAIRRHELGAISRTVWGVPAL